MKKTNTRVRRDGGSKPASPQVPNKPNKPKSESGRFLTPKEFRVVALRECPMPDDMLLCDSPEFAVEYWRANIQNSPQFNPAKECLAVLILNTRRRCVGHVLESIGTRDTLLIDPGSIFRAAIVADAAAIIMMHNHPSGESEPSEADIKITRDLIRAGSCLRVAVLDHIVMGVPQAAKPKGYSSLKELGYFYA